MRIIPTQRNEDNSLIKFHLKFKDFKITPFTINDKLIQVSVINPLVFKDDSLPDFLRSEDFRMIILQLQRHGIFDSKDEISCRYIRTGWGYIGSGNILLITIRQGY